MGPNTQRSDGDVVAHATVMARASAVNKGDIDDRFPDQGETGVRSMEYLPEIRRRLSEADQLLLGTVDVTILCGEQPRMKKRLADMQGTLAAGLTHQPGSGSRKGQQHGWAGRDRAVSRHRGACPDQPLEGGVALMPTEKQTDPALLLAWAAEQAAALLAPLGHRWRARRGASLQKRGRWAPP